MSNKNTEKAAAILIIILVSVGAAIAYLLWLPTPITPILRHVNPAAETEQKPYPNFLTPLVLDPLRSLAIGNYSETAGRIRNLIATYIPETLKFIINRFTQLLNQTANLLETTENLLKTAENLIDAGREGDAKTILTEASINLAQANLTYNELKAASDELARTFFLQKSQISKEVEDIGKLIENLHQRLNTLLSRLEKQKNLEKTILEINVFPRTLWTGGKITLVGRLHTDRKALPGRNIAIFIDGVKMGETKTLWKGIFIARLHLPYIYKQKIVVEARYTPTGDDASLYKPAVSNPIEINLLYIKPKIRAEPAGTVLPGKSFLLKGTVEANQSLPYSTIKILWAEENKTVNLKEGKFETILHVPENIPEGKHTLKIEAQAWGIFAPAQANLFINVERLPLNITIETPAFTLSGAGAFLRGQITYEDEPFNVTIKAIFLGQTQTLNASSKFELQLNPPLTLLTDYYNYEIYVTPTLPWYKSSTIKGSILILNPITITLPTGLILALALKLSRSQRMEQAGAREEETPTEPRIERLPEKPFATEELKWVIEAYWQSIAIIENISGVKMKPSTTFREYFTSVAPKIGELHNEFKTLTFIAEKILYAEKVSAEELESARRAINKLKVKNLEANI